MNIDKSKSGYVFNIQQFSVHDGPGIRTIVFLKGCPLHCRWCSNPESQSTSIELAWSSSKCMGCHHCMKTCPNKAITQGDSGKIKINRNLCKKCFKCTEVCPTSALSAFGKEMTISQVLNQVESDSAFYSRSDGGMTLSGGEPLLQAEFAIDLLKEARHHGIRTAIETCGDVEWLVLEQACKQLTTVIYDIKCIDASKHKRYTGLTNKQILSNFEKMCRQFQDLPILARTPIIPGFNDSEKDVLEIIDFIKQFPNVSYELLQYHRLGEPKYLSLGREYTMGDIKLSDEAFNHLKLVAKKRFENEKIKK